MREDGIDYPDGLTPAERRVLDYLRAGTLDAETSVRLGLPIGDVKDRIESILRKTGAKDRVELAGWRAPQPEALADAGPPAGEGEPISGEAVALERPRTVSRRAVLAVLGVAAGAGVAGILAKLATTSTRHTPAASGAPATDANQLATAAGLSGSRLEGLMAGELLTPLNLSAVIRAGWAQGESIPWGSGVFFMDTVTGEVEGWQVRDHGFGEPVVSRGGAWFGAPGVLVHRTSRRAWEFDAARLNLLAVASHVALFNDVADGKQPYSFATVTLGETRATARFTQGMTAAPLLSPDGQAAVILSAPPGEAPVLTSVRLTDGLSTPFYKADRVESGSFAQNIRFSAQGPRGFSLELSWANREYSSVFFDWETYTPATWDSSTYVPAAYGPARRVLREETRFRGGGDGGGEWWPSLVAGTLAAKDDFHVRSGAISYGDRFPGERWLAGNRGFVAMVNSGADNADPIGYAEIGLDRSMRPFALPKIDAGRWFEENYHRGALPSPDDPDILAFGRLEVFNRTLGRWFRALMSDDSGPQHLDPWATGSSRELVFAWPHGGHGGPAAPTLLRPRTEAYRELPAEMRARVAGSGDCLNLRETPGLEGKVLACLADGAEVRITPAASADGQSVPRASEHRLDGTWIRVAAGPNTGWVSSAYLEWAD